ncbi:pantoate--beta-alanine ligase [Listeria fleischmannii]|uniref:Pantothenate synthetase n=1 Tax=Listeria fleischmannii TaxID=1069827 RepID=A0A841YCZ1_9LIST|nr:pantoate--beta-alanine ligase [Listeria fleischmannii]MBC1398185.1 pantoate--beta-alanine ligase [Listeria fleischmannii]MBC1426246.1 pantoate--beta-alanine ligase [Listeria fleischmannii]STY35513.1 Pantothenate synthetase [Listeria fleischmannii subsp. coloradonensis]
MRIVRTRQELHQSIKSLEAGSIGFVPTMGYLHEGHLALIQKAKVENDFVVMSIFVNPLQFGPNEDLTAYPRDEKHDLKLAEEQGVDILFLPNVSEIYPTPLSTTIHVEKRVDVLDGEKRPGHFDGVATVLFKLFHLVMPNRAYFGQKDAQQLAIVEALVEDYFLPITIRRVETVREADGLAKSSRNINLTVDERKEAPIIHQALLAGKKCILDGVEEETTILAEVQKTLGKVTKKVDYLALYEYPSFKTVTDFSSTLILAIAVQYEKARLIDNELIKRGVEND